MADDDRSLRRALTPGQRAGLTGAAGVVALVALLAFAWMQVHAAGAGGEATAHAEQRLAVVGAFVVSAAVVAVVAHTRRVARLARRRAREEARLRVDMHRSRLDATLQRALDMTGSEEHVAFVVERALRAASPEHPVEWKLSDLRTGHLRRVVVSDADARWAGCDVVEPEHCPAILRGETRVFASSDQIDACWHLQGRPGGRCSAVCVPVGASGRAVGVFHRVGREHEHPGEIQLGDLELIARKAGERIGLLRVMLETETEARTDSLTGLLNRRTVERSVGLLDQEGVPYAVAFGDLDHFKRLNDLHGHATGDRALRLFAHVLRDAVRPSDIVGRYGGEEFVVVLPGCDSGDALPVVERVRRQLHEAFANAGVPAFTVSFGIADTVDAPRFGEVVRLADECLLEAKAAGRDRIVVHPRLPGPGRMLDLDAGHTSGATVDPNGVP